MRERKGKGESVREHWYDYLSVTRPLVICAMTFWAFCMLNVMSSRSLRIPSICFVWSFRDGRRLCDAG